MPSRHDASLWLLAMSLGPVPPWSWSRVLVSGPILWPFLWPSCLTYSLDAALGGPQAECRSGVLRRWASKSISAAGVMPSMRAAWAKVAGR